MTSRKIWENQSLKESRARYKQKFVLEQKSLEQNKQIKQIWTEPENFWRIALG